MHVLNAGLALNIPITSRFLRPEINVFLQRMTRVSQSVSPVMYLLPHIVNAGVQSATLPSIFRIEACFVFRRQLKEFLAHIHYIMQQIVWNPMINQLHLPSQN